MVSHSVWRGWVCTAQMYTVMIIDVKQHTQTNVNILLNILQRWNEMLVRLFFMGGDRKSFFSSPLRPGETDEWTEE